MKLIRSKKNALIQLINCKEEWSVKRISDLSDGKLFCDIIENVFPESFEVLKNEGQIIVSYEELSKNEEFSMNVDSKSEHHEAITADSKCEKTVIKDLKTVQTPSVESVPEQINSAAQDEEIVESAVNENASVSKPVKFALNNSASLTDLDNDKPSGKDNVLATNRYRLIQYFIDGRYNLKSNTVINYSECWKGNELELAKILNFILSEVVRHYVRLDDPFIHTLPLLDPAVQQDLTQCFNFFINERSKITKADIEKLLTHSSFSKVESSPEKNYSTPARRCSSKYKHISPNLSSSSVFTNSPLKTYFESPVFTKADIISKDKELGKLREIVHKEEVNSWSLKEQIETLKRKVEEKNKEINDLKRRNRLIQEVQEDSDCKNCLEHKKVIKGNLKYIKKLNNDREKEKEMFHKALEEYYVEHDNYQIEVGCELIKFQFEMRNAEETIAQVDKELQKALEEKNYLEKKVEELSEKLNDKIKELEVYKEKLRDAEKKVKEEPESSVLGECMGEYFKENENSSFDISHKKLSVPLQEKSVKDVMVQYPEESFVVNHLQPSPNRILKSYNKNISSRSPKKQKPNECDVSPEMDFQSKQCVNLVPKETSYQSVSKNSFGSLWLKCNDSDDKNINNNNFSIKNGEFDYLWQNNDVIPEIKNIDEIYTTNGLTNALSILHKTALYLNNVSNYSATSNKISSVHNGSSGLFSSPVIKEFLETIKQSIQNSLLCLSEAGKSQMKFKNNNNSISAKMITDTGVNSDGVLKCAECLKVGNNNSTNVILDKNLINSQESSTLCESVRKNQEGCALVENATKIQESSALVENAIKDQSSALVENTIKDQSSALVENTIKDQSSALVENTIKDQSSALVENAIQDQNSALVENAIKDQSSALLEKTQELDKLKNKYMESKKKLFLTENEYKKYRGKYYHLKIEFQESLKMIKDKDLRCQKLQNYLKGAKQREDELEREWKEAKAVIKLQSEELLENKKKLDLNKEQFNKHVEKMKEEYTKYERIYLSRMNHLSSYTKYLEGKLKHIMVTMNLASTSKEREEFKRLRGAMAEGAMAENTNDDSSEIVSQYTLDESMLNRALQPKGLHSALHIDDEEDIFNHSSLVCIQEDPESEGKKRLDELSRRNSLYPKQLRSVYPVENLIQTPIEKNSSSHHNRNNQCRVRHLPEKNEHVGKKRKVSNMMPENQSEFCTPVVKAKRKFLQTPTSLKKWRFKSRKQSLGFVKPKP